ncbi:hypothetical protein GCM10023238_06180 [Streptomyces heliomycini]
MDAYTRTDVTPDDAKETGALVASYKRFAEGCGADAPKLLRHVSTVEAARTWTSSGAALGDGKLNYVGASYGTFLGATYAGLFPDRAGRLVLDGAMDPRCPRGGSTSSRRRVSTRRSPASRRTACGGAAARLAAGAPGVGRAGDNLRAFFEKLDARPIPTGDADGRRLTESARDDRRHRRDVRRGRLAATARGADGRDEGERTARTPPPLRQLLRT